MRDQHTYDWDIFVSHASEDKDDFVRPLAEQLTRRGLRIWYDEHTLSIGDSLRQRIDDGLARSRFGLVVLSHAFFSKSWPAAELDALVAREEDEGRLILPIWYELSRTDVARYSPLLAGRLAVPSSIGLAAVVERIFQAVSGKEVRPSESLGSRRALITGRALDLGIDDDDLSSFYEDEPET